MKPLIIVNFKTYKEATGSNAVRLARICEKVARESNVKIIAAVQAADIFRVASAVDIPVFAQHVDNIMYGKNTGYILPESVKDAGASGTLLNHAEHKLDDTVLAATITRCKESKLTTVVCAANNREAVAAARLDPDFIAVELPELIGTLRSVSTVNPEVVTSSIAAVRKIKNIPILCGAGVANGEDVRKALELGTEGVILATAIVCAKDQEKALRELVEH